LRTGLSKSPRFRQDSPYGLVIACFINGANVQELQFPDFPGIELDFPKKGDSIMKMNNSVTMLRAAVIILATGGALLATQTSDRIESSARKSYVFMTYLNGDDISIKSTNDSDVILTGTVSEWSHRALAEETVRGLPGVMRVENKLEVKSGKPDETSDVWTGMKVKFMLMFHKNVSSLKTEITVKDGIVTLRGETPSEAQKELTTEYAKDVQGVKGVKNDMTVEKTGKTTVEKMTEFIDDASITGQVKLALLFHRGTSVIKTKVETKDGIVTVSGVAKNSAEKELVGKLVTNIKGVKELKNKITIGPVVLK
jgi:osmotically-inducible protein OsmY